ncbi:MAG: hypothetical protein RSA09_09975 [Acinetobacter sp.]
MKKISTFIAAGLLTTLSATAFACPQGTTLSGGTGANHKGGKCVATMNVTKHDQAMKQDKIAKHDQTMKQDKMAKHDPTMRQDKMVKHDSMKWPINPIKMLMLQARIHPKLNQIHIKS